METAVNDLSLCDAAQWYQEHGFYVHPLSSPNDGKPAPGKRPILTGWTQPLEHLPDKKLSAYFKKEPPNNLGLVCGEKSDCTVIDRDFIVKGIWEGIKSSQLVIQQRWEGRDHLFFNYCDGMQAAKYHALGFEVLNDGSNCVLTPSIHHEGQPYRFVQGDPQNRPDMPQEIIDRIKSTVNTFDKLLASVNRCRPTFQKFFKAYFTDNQKSNTLFRDMSVFHGGTGRDLNLFLFAELKANGATDDELVLLCKLIFLDNYDSQKSEYQITKIAKKATVKTETIKKHSILSQFYDSDRETDTPTKAAKEERNPEETLRLHAKAISDMQKYKNQKESARQAVCSTIWKNAGLDGRAFNKAYLEAFPPDQAKEEQAREEPAPTHIRERAREIAYNEDPLKFIIATHQSLHVGDIGLATTLLLSTTCQHVLNTDGIQPKLSGSSGKGKSDCAKGMAHCLPPEWVMTTSLSDKAIYYMEDELRPGTVVFLDDVILSEEMEKVINRATTFYQTGATHTTLDINRNKISLRIPARLTWWLTSIDDDQSLQLLNRTFGGEVDESHEQDVQVAKRQREKAKTGEIGLPLNDNVLTCREIIRDIKERTYIVKIPFADAVIWRDEVNRRNQPMFLDLIKAFAVLRHRQRETDTDGALIATYQDFIDAKILYTSRQEAQKTKLTASERKLCEVLSDKGSMTFQGLCKELSVGKSRLSQILNGRGRNHDSGALFKVKELWEEDTSIKNDAGGYTKQKLYGFDGNFNPLEGYESVVDFDTGVYPVYSMFTTCLPYENVSGRILFTMFTYNLNKQNSNISHDKSDLLIDSITQKGDEKNESNNPISAKQQKHGKHGKQKAHDNETQKVNTGKHQCEQVNHLDAHRWLTDWEKVNSTTINSQNYQEAATEYATKHNADLSEVLYLTCKYAGIEEVNHEKH